MKFIYLIIVINAFQLSSVFQLSATSYFRPNIETYPMPTNEKKSMDYKVRANNKEIDIYYARVSAIPINVYPGVNRPLEQTEKASFCYFDINGKTTVTIKPKEHISNVIIRPLSLKIIPIIKINSNTIIVNISKPCQFVVEINGRHKALHIFVNQIKHKLSEKTNRNILYFGPGIYYCGIINIKDNEIIYLAGGAVVHGVIQGSHVKNVKIMGRGILDGSTFKRESGLNIIRLKQCDNILIDGIILRDSPLWTLVVYKSNNIKINNIKIIGMWRYNSDGIDIVSSHNISINKSFIRTFDDCVAIKGNNLFTSSNTIQDNQDNVKNISVSNCVIWNDWGTALQIGAETVADSIYNVTYKNCDIIHFVHIAMGIQNGNRAIISNIKYENIRVENPITKNVFIDDLNNPIKNISQIHLLNDKNIYKFKENEVGLLFSINIKPNGWAKDIRLGTVSNIFYNNIKYISSRKPTSLFDGYSTNHTISNIYLNNIIINNHYEESCSAANILLNKFAINIYFK